MAPPAEDLQAPTRVGSPPPPPPPQRSDLDLTTLVLSAVASACAAYVTSKVWAPGTLASAAMSPVIVALVKEGLRRPTEVVTQAVPAAPRLRARAGGRRRPVASSAAPTEVRQDLELGAPPPLPPPVAGAEAGPVRVYSARGRRLRWRVALVTGVLGFVICALAYTVPELIAGQSVARSGRATTLWGGRHHSSHSGTTTTTSTTGTAAAPATPAQTTTAPAATTPQAPAQTTTTPPAATPQATTPQPSGGAAAPEATTPQPPATTTP